MRITQEVDYAMRFVLILSNLGPEVRTDAKTLSEEVNVPLRFSLKILRKLSHSGIVKSYRGVKGGYVIDKDPAEITMKDVVEAIDGPIYLNKCLEADSFCNLNRVKKCSIHNAWQGVQDKIESELESITFGDLMK